MDGMRISLRVAVLFTLGAMLAVGLVACSGSDGGTTDQSAAEADPAMALIETKCSMCHSTDQVWSADKTREEWVDTVDRMKTNGLVVTDEEYDQITDYLAGQ